MTTSASSATEASFDAIQRIADIWNTYANIMKRTTIRIPLIRVYARVR